MKLKLIIASMLGVLLFTFGVNAKGSTIEKSEMEFPQAPEEKFDDNLNLVPEEKDTNSFNYWKGGSAANIYINNVGVGKRTRLKSNNLRAFDWSINARISPIEAIHLRRMVPPFISAKGSYLFYSKTSPSVYSGVGLEVGYLVGFEYPISNAEFVLGKEYTLGNNQKSFVQLGIDGLPLLGTVGALDDNNRVAKYLALSSVTVSYGRSF